LGFLVSERDIFVVRENFEKYIILYLKISLKFPLVVLQSIGGKMWGKVVQSGVIQSRGLSLVRTLTITPENLGFS
jgi:hypothetical protein